MAQGMTLAEARTVSYFDMKVWLLQKQHQEAIDNLIEQDQSIATMPFADEKEVKKSRAKIAREINILMDMHNDPVTFKVVR